MIFDWCNIFNKTEFVATGLVARTLTVTLDEIGSKDIHITRGNMVGVQYGETFLCVEMEGRNPYVRDGLAVYLDASDNVWLGIEVAE